MNTFIAIVEMLEAFGRFFMQPLCDLVNILQNGEIDRPEKI